MLRSDLSRLQAILLALFVTFLWSTSWVLIKLVIDDIPALTFAGLRYALAALVLLPFALRRGLLPALRSAPAPLRWRLVGLGLLMYAATQGAQFWALATLPAVTASLLYNFTTPLVALFGLAALGERLVGRQWLGIGVFLGGVLIYFTPDALPAAYVPGLLIAGLGVLANAGATLIGRGVNREAGLDPLHVTAFSMLVGAPPLLVAGVAWQGLPPISALGWAIIVWMAVVNGALAFTLWNRALRTLPAAEASIINNTMLIQIAALAWLFLGEQPGPRGLLGLALAALGALLVQWRGRITWVRITRA